MSSFSNMMDESTSEQDKLELIAWSADQTARLAVYLASRWSSTFTRQRVDPALTSPAPETAVENENDYDEAVVAQLQYEFIQGAADRTARLLQYGFSFLPGETSLRELEMEVERLEREILEEPATVPSHAFPPSQSSDSPAPLASPSIHHPLDESLIDDLNRTIHLQQTEIDNLRGEIRTAKAGTAAANGGEISKVKQELHDLTTGSSKTITRLEERISKMTSEHEAAALQHRDKIRLLKSEASDRATEIRNTTASKHAAEISKIKSEQDEAASQRAGELETLHSEATEQAAKIRTLSRSNQALEDRVEELEDKQWEENRPLLQRLDWAEAANKRLREQLSKSEKARKELEQESEAAKPKNVEAMVGQIKTLEKEKRKAEEELRSRVAQSGSMVGQLEKAEAEKKRVQKELEAKDEEVQEQSKAMERLQKEVAAQSAKLREQEEKLKVANEEAEKLRIAAKEKKQAKQEPNAEVAPKNLGQAPILTGKRVTIVAPDSSRHSAPEAAPVPIAQEPVMLEVPSPHMEQAPEVTSVMETPLVHEQPAPSTSEVTPFFSNQEPVSVNVAPTHLDLSAIATSQSEPPVVGEASSVSAREPDTANGWDEETFEDVLAQVNETPEPQPLSPQMTAELQRRLKRKPISRRAHPKQQSTRIGHVKTDPPAKISSETQGHVHQAHSANDEMEVEGAGSSLPPSDNSLAPQDDMDVVDDSGSHSKIVAEDAMETEENTSPTVARALADGKPGTQEMMDLEVDTRSAEGEPMEAEADEVPDMGDQMDADQTSAAQVIPCPDVSIDDELLGEAAPQDTTKQSDKSAREQSKIKLDALRKMNQRRNPNALVEFRPGNHKFAPTLPPAKSTNALEAREHRRKRAPKTQKYAPLVAQQKGKEAKRYTAQSAVDPSNAEEVERTTRAAPDISKPPPDLPDHLKKMMKKK